MPGEVSRSYEGPIDAIAAAVPGMEAAIREQFPDIDARHRPPRNVTCDAVRKICEADGKDYAVLISVDRKAGSTLFTTWGRTAEDKVDASDLSDHLSQKLCPSPRGLGEVYESFKLDAARNKAMVESLVDILEFFLVATDPLLDATSFDAYDAAAHHAVAKRAREVVAAFRATRVGGKGGTGGTAGSGR